MEIAKRDPEPMVLHMALSNIKEQADIVDVVENGCFEINRCAALGYLMDKEVVRRIAQESQHEEIRRAANWHLSNWDTLRQTLKH